MPRLLGALGEGGRPVTDDPLQLARDLAHVASDLERRGYPYAPGVRRAARALLHLSMINGHGGDPDGCPGCGRTVHQPERGRRRRWCSERCRRRYRR